MHRNRAGKSLQLPPPPSKSGRKITPTIPPLEFTEVHRLPPPRNRAGKSLHLPPPSNLRKFIDYPPLEIGPENHSNYPPSNLRKFIDYPPPLEIGPENHSNYPPPPPLEFTGSSHCRFSQKRKPALRNNLHDATDPYLLLVMSLAGYRREVSLAVSCSICLSMMSLTTLTPPQPPKFLQMISRYTLSS